jgi:hypothetical protein
MLLEFQALIDMLRIPKIASTCEWHENKEIVVKMESVDGDPSNPVNRLTNKSVVPPNHMEIIVDLMLC